jgi:hypothetical protein
MIDDVDNDLAARQAEVHRCILDILRDSNLTLEDAWLVVGGVIASMLFQFPPEMREEAACLMQDQIKYWLTQSSLKKGDAMRQVMNLDRSEYGKIYHQVFGKAASRGACRGGWERWQEALASNLSAIAVHPPGTPVPDSHPNDYWAFAVLGPLLFQARIYEALLPRLPEMWLQFIRAESSAKLVAALGQNPRQRARAFVQNSLVDGYVMHPVIGPAMAGAIAWLLSNVETVPIELKDYHFFGYDISHVPGPLGQPTMFNFRAVFNLAIPERLNDMLASTRAIPLPEWRPPPH